MLQEAVEKMGLKISSGSRLLADARFSGLHSAICGKHPAFARCLDRLYLPKLDKKKPYDVFTSNNIALLNRGLFRRLKDRYDVRTVLVTQNVFNNERYPELLGRNIEDLKEEFDLIVTTERADAERFGLLFMPNTFYNPLGNEVPEVIYDLSFAGADKGRGTGVRKIAGEAKKAGVSADMRIVGNGPKNGAVKYVPPLPYTEIIRRDLETNCILELLQPGQTTATLRYQEAVCLNKKLLTNNPYVEQEDFYDPRFIRVFRDEKDIDWDFVKERIKVDYGYDGRYSSPEWVRKIQMELDRRKDI
ncbi:MAG: hypothetical protein K6F53_05830 [Lachnospiraceae bacterium]|nr:hypothetical protein [Lachnospiraceae bacterium]